jgi:glycosyltransferase involved in cell wall biosynthesis
MTKVRLVIPVYNDWASFHMLLQELDAVAASVPFQLFVSAVDDGSFDEAMPTLSDLSALRHLVGVEIITLAVNVGHQRAIAVGLCVAAQEHDFDAVLIMDADGEDPPQAIKKSSLVELVTAKTFASSHSATNAWKPPRLSSSIFSTRSSSNWSQERPSTLAISASFQAAMSIAW